MTDASSTNPKDVAERYLRSFEGEGIDTSECYECTIGDRWKQEVSAEGFAAEVRRISDLLGGAVTSRVLAKSNEFSKLPISNEDGRFAAVSFDTQYPNAKVSEEVVLEFDATSACWKVVGAHIRPALS